MSKVEILREIGELRTAHLNEYTAQTNDLTYDEIEQFFRVRHDAARKLMLELVKRGLFTREVVKIEGKRRTVFRKVDGK